MACCYIAAFCVGQLVKACQFFDFDEGIRYNDEDAPAVSKPPVSTTTTRLERTTEIESNSTILSLSGLTCSACIQTVESALRTVPGVSDARVSLQLQQATVIHDATTMDAKKSEMLLQVCRDAGYEAEPGPRPRAEVLEMLNARREIKECKVTCYEIMKYSTAVSILHWLSRLLVQPRIMTTSSYFLAWVLCWSSVAVSLLCQFRCMSQVHLEAWRLAKSKNTSMNTLVSLSTALGLFITILDLLFQGPLFPRSYETTTLGLTLVVTSGRLLDLLSRRQASKNLVDLFGLFSRMELVTLYPSGKTVPSGFARPGDQIVIHPYCLIPCDCYITEGASQVDESILTGESIPVDKTVGDFLLAGTRSLQGSPICTVYKGQEHSFYNRLLEEVTDAMATKNRSYQYFDTIIGHFVLGVVILAVAVPVYRFLSFSGPPPPFLDRLTRSVEQMMTILVSACPCALGLASPSAIAALVDAARKKGILIAEAATTIDQLACIDRVVLDKTGTLTQGLLKVEACLFKDAWARRADLLWTLLCIIEEDAAGVHPVAGAIFKHGIQQLGHAWQNFKRSEAHVIQRHDTPGKGVCGVVEISDDRRHIVYIGSLGFLEESGVEMLSEIQSDHTSGVKVYVAVDGKHVVTILLQDGLRIDASSTIRDLNKDGLGCCILTGDSEAEAKRVADLLKIPVLASEAVPSKKLDYLRSLQRQGHKVAMVGDGLNDAPSLAAADVGIIVSNGPTTFTAGGSVLLLNSEIGNLPLLLRMAKRTRRQIRFNLNWAFTYNIVSLLLATGIVKPLGMTLTPSLGAALMSISSVAITLQSLRLREALASMEK